MQVFYMDRSCGVVVEIVSSIHDMDHLNHVWQMLRWTRTLCLALPLYSTAPRDMRDIVAPKYF